MSNMNFNFLLDKDTYKDALDGAVKLYGTAKRKLPRMLKPAKSVGEKALDFVEDHKKEFLIAGGAVALVGAAGAVIALNKRRATRKLERLLDAYLVGMKNGTLTPGFLVNFLAELEKGKKALVMSEKQLDSVYVFTVKLASAQGVDVDLARENLDLKRCLEIQKNILGNMGE